MANKQDAGWQAAIRQAQAQRDAEDAIRQRSAWEEDEALLRKMAETLGIPDDVCLYMDGKLHLAGRYTVAPLPGGEAVQISLEGRHHLLCWPRKEYGEAAMRWAFAGALDRLESSIKVPPLDDGQLAVIAYLEEIVRVVRAGEPLEPGQAAVWGLARWVDAVDGRD